MNSHRRTNNDDKTANIHFSISLWIIYQVILVIGTSRRLKYYDSGDTSRRNGIKDCLNQSGSACKQIFSIC